MERGRPIAMLMNVFLTVITTSHIWRGDGRGVLDDRGGLAANRGEGRGLLLCARGVAISENSCLGVGRGVLCALCEEPISGQAWKEDANGHGIAGGQTSPSSTAAAAFGHRGVVGRFSSKDQLETGSLKRRGAGQPPPDIMHMLSRRPMSSTRHGKESGEKAGDTCGSMSLDA